MLILTTLLTELLKALLPELLSFAWEKSHAPTTIENAAPDPALRDRLLSSIRLQRTNSDNNPNH
jgi:hypothetical protein